MRELSRREVGGGATGAGAALVRRRLDALESRLTFLALGSRGCAHCRGWGALAVTYSEEAQETVRDGDPERGWPETLSCPRCGREPTHVVRVVYEDVPGPIDLLPAQEWRGRTS